ncbi:MAG: type II toxin-antitoxin system prevent-host-death family antitoxin [Gammaproteobacteria bacterium]|nr:MAG: type II toxin-antitoxin system prevent-host-death family antitoxin [Gammaproteobacteria bacterium]
METINIHEAKTHLSRLVEEVAMTQQPIIIAKAGKPRVQIVPLDKPLKKRQMGTLKGKLNMPDNFDRLYEKEIAKLFNEGQSSDEDSL